MSMSHLECNSCGHFKNHWTKGYCPECGSTNVNLDIDHSELEDDEDINES